MSETLRKINAFFRTAVKSDVDRIESGIILSDRQKEIFDMFYLKRKDIGYIADTLCVCQRVVNKELRAIRQRIVRVIDL